MPASNIVSGVANPGKGDEQVKKEKRQIYRDLDFFNSIYSCINCFHFQKEFIQVSFMSSESSKYVLKEFVLLSPSKIRSIA